MLNFLFVRKEDTGNGLVKINVCKKNFYWISPTENRNNFKRSCPYPGKFKCETCLKGTLNDYI